MSQGWAPWTQPVLTSDTDYGVVSASSVNSSAGALPFKASDGIMTGTTTSWESAKAAVPSTWKWVLPHRIRISQIVLYNKYSGSTNVTRDVQIYADEAMTIPIGEMQTFEAFAFSTVTVTPATPVETDTIVIYCSTSHGAAGNDYVGLGEVVITAEYPAVTHEVVFEDWDGTVLSTQIVVDGDPAVAPTDPTRAGFSFAGWNADFSAVTTDMTIMATYALDSTVFDYYEMLGNGHFPAAVHMMDNGFRIFYIDSNGIVKGMECFPALGLYDNLAWRERGRMSPDTTVSHMSLKKIAHHGAYGFWSAMGDHRFMMYMLATDVSKYFVKGVLNITKDSAVSSASFTLQNPDQMLLTRNRSALSPNAYISLHFALGSSPEVAIGKWYIDKVTSKMPGGDVSVTARNGIGKYLKEQSFDEHTTWIEGGFTDNIKAILAYAGVEDYFVGDAHKDWQLEYEPDATLLKGIEDLVKLLPFWTIAETMDGTVGVARFDDARFDQPSTHRFVLNQNCWKYTTEYTDEETYSRLCVYCKEPENRLYYDLPYHKLWPMPAHRTLFAKVPDGTDLATMQTYASSLIDGIAESGRTETFVGRFTPQLVIGDQIELIDGIDVEVIGTVTTVRHTLGKSGFYTEFTTDSGGRKGRLTLSDYVSQIGKGGTANCIIVEEPPEEEETPVTE